MIAPGHIVDLLTPGQLVDLTGDPPFVPDPARPVRVTFAWTVDGQLRGRVLPGERAATVIVTWPTSPIGRIDPARLRDARVREWHLTRSELNDLRRWTELWPVDRHDFLVDARLAPCTGSLRAHPAFDGQQQRIERLIASLSRP